MQQLKMHSADLTQTQLSQLQQLFPHCFSEGRIDFELLKQELSDHLIEGNQERYQLNWVGKRESILAANAPVAKTLRPMRAESVHFDTTENLFIEGDNLDALKLLQETYLGKVKMIYIDPPYNTGNDFVYKDDFAENRDDFLNRSNQTDEQGNRLVSNPESNGRFHSDWLSMIYPRLKLARNLLADDGVIFISIDDNEQANLKRVCDEIFGEQNFVAQIIWERAYSPVNLKKHFSESHDFLICYSRDKEQAICNGLKRSEEANNRYANPDNDPRGVWKSSDLSVGPAIQENIYEITTPSGRKVFPPSGYSWRLNKERFAEFVANNRIWFGESGNNVPSIKRFLSETKQTITPMTIWKYQDVGHSQSASQRLKEIFDGKAFFDYPKPVDLIKRTLELYSSSNCVILDFFAGSATTAHAVMQLNAEDNGNRKFIMVQLPENTDEKSEAYKAGFATIAEISKERIRRAGKQIAEQNPNVDIGFRVLKIDSSNMADVFYTPQQLSQDDLFTNAVKNDRTAEDLLFQAMLDLGIALSSSIERQEIQGRTVFNVANQQLIACFDEIDENLITELAELKPQQAVFLDTKFANDSVKINAVQIFRQISPNSVLSVI